MGVYIPNMKKPKSCRTCKFTSSKEGECWFVHDENDCPLIEISTPHGRLIDADKYEYPGDLIYEPTILESEEDK